MLMAVIILQEKLIAKMMHIIWKLSLFLCNCLENVKNKKTKNRLRKADSCHTIKNKKILIFVEL